MVGVTADSNIYVSALNFGGVPNKLLDMARAGDISLSISDDILDEIERVLCDKFRWTEDAVKLARERIGDLTEKVQPSQKVDAVKNDPTDNMILECGIAAASHFIVTGDKHLLELGSFRRH